ncbi:hypothetical protein BgiBS90_012341 [Biomphalaria glabrata]|nr:hypothetical protein BgiBS90_012341 [Biomphalaria glabrata]
MSMLSQLKGNIVIIARTVKWPYYVLVEKGESRRWTRDKRVTSDNSHVLNDKCSTGDGPWSSAARSKVGRNDENKESKDGRDRDCCAERGSHVR